MENNEQIDSVTAGWPIPAKLKDGFTAFCQKEGDQIARACAGALFIWPFIPSQLRVWAKRAAQGDPPIDSEFWEKYRDLAESAMQRGLFEFLSSAAKRPANISDMVNQLEMFVTDLKGQEMDQLPMKIQRILVAIFEGWTDFRPGDNSKYPLRITDEMRQRFLRLWMLEADPVMRQKALRVVQEAIASSAQSRIPPRAKPGTRSKKRKFQGDEDSSQAGR